MERWYFLCVSDAEPLILIKFICGSNLRRVQAGAD